MNNQIQPQSINSKGTNGWLIGHKNVHLTNVSKWYANTTQYYQDIFNKILEFQKISEAESVVCE